MSVVVVSVVTAAMATRESVGISGVSQNDLTFDSVGVKDGGVYTCTASNSRGSVKMDVHLNVARQFCISICENILFFLLSSESRGTGFNSIDFIA